MNFLVVTIHYLKEDRKSFATHLLDAFAFPEHEELATHTAKGTVALVEEVLKNFTLDINDCIACTTDTTNAMPSAVIKVLKLDWVPCQGHVLQLSINSALGSHIIMKRLINWSRKVVRMSGLIMPRSTTADA